jgi:hypothetical protein
VLTVIGIVRIQTLTVYTLRLDAVSVNPEAKRHVRIAHQVNDSTAANVGILVGITVAILNKHNAKDRRNGDVVDSVRRTEGGEEHVVNVLSERVAMRATERRLPQCNLQPVCDVLVESISGVGG